ncbi:hypothetical protein [Streptomyces sp. CBMA156]|uniref:hypothetical protein n=1 Tax=Streptomyces sp. CBMA156 TaxID=1930280 RepID=UPI0016620E12|nr:hypothetical protein [Streptomyces sp. CBMA156]MBD0671653.1 hypothetical protein [Streptomyces sp. CBMA156]
MDGRTDGGDIEQQDQEQPGEPPAAAEVPTAPAAPVASEGVALLMKTARDDPRAALPGRLLTQQALYVDGLLATGWQWCDLVPQIAAPRPDPQDVRTSDAAITVARIRAIPKAPPATRSAEGTVPSQVARPAPSQPTRPAVNHRCPGYPGRDNACGQLVRVDGMLCPACLDERTARERATLRPCTGADCPHQAMPDAPDGLCPSCAARRASADLPRCSTPDCDRPAVLHGQCTRCRRRDREAEVPSPADTAADSDVALERTIERFNYRAGATRPGGCIEGVNGCKDEAVMPDGRCEDCHAIWTGHVDRLNELAPAYAGQDAQEGAPSPFWRAITASPGTGPGGAATGPQSPRGARSHPVPHMTGGPHHSKG